MKKYKVVSVSNCRGENFPSSFELHEAESIESLSQKLLKDNQDSLIKQLEEDEGRELTEIEKTMYLEFSSGVGEMKDSGGLWWVETGEEDFLLVVHETHPLYELVDKVCSDDASNADYEQWDELTEMCQ